MFDSIQPLADVDIDEPSYRQRVKQAAETILNQQAYPAELSLAINDLAAVFTQLTTLDVNSTNTDDTTETILNEGKALSPRDAARCLLDIARTTQFIRGIHAAITDLFDRFPGEQINIVYAGCGPYATLLVPLFSQFKDTQIKVTMIDIHQHSLDAARYLVDQLDYSDFVQDYVQCDATRYQHPETQAVHLAITETMQKALAKEPQLAVTANLVPQLVEGGVLIPQQISIELCLANAKKEFSMQSAETVMDDVVESQRERIDVGTVMTINSQNAVAIYQRCEAGSKGKEPSDTATKFTISEPPVGIQFQAMLLTHITVHGEHKLGDYDSGLTVPTVLHGVGTVKGGEQLTFDYDVGEVPGFNYRYCATYTV